MISSVVLRITIPETLADALAAQACRSATTVSAVVAEVLNASIPRNIEQRRRAQIGSDPPPKTSTSSASLTEDIEDALLIACSWPSGLRRFFADHAITGIPMTHDCVLARWLHRATGATCLMGSTSVDVTRGTQDAEVHLPTGIQLFVEAFDRGEFPELVDNTPEISVEDSE